MTDALTRLLGERDWILADGATGTNLFAMGLEAGEAPELWNESHPERIRALHESFIEAGADLILTNSFGGTRQRLKLHGAQDRVHELNRKAAEIARAAADAEKARSGRMVIVAGSIGPTGELLEPVGALSFEDAVSAFEEQARGLIEGGVDVLWAETMSSEDEMRAAAEAARRLNAPFSGTMSFDTAGRTMMGVAPGAWARLAPGLPQPPIACGANCGVGAPDMLRTIQSMTAADPAAVVVAKGNAGIPKYVAGAIHYDGTPELMARYAVLARDSGARIIGGCCGTKPEHLRAMRAALEAAPRGERPSAEDIVAAVGPFSFAEAPETPPSGEARKSRRRG